MPESQLQHVDTAWRTSIMALANWELHEAVNNNSVNPILLCIRCHYWRQFSSQKVEVFFCGPHPMWAKSGLVGFKSSNTFYKSRRFFRSGGFVMIFFSAKEMILSFHKRTQAKAMLRLGHNLKHWDVAHCGLQHTFYESRRILRSGDFVMFFSPRSKWCLVFTNVRTYIYI